MFNYYGGITVPIRPQRGARDELRLDDIAVQTCSKPLPVSLVSFNANPVEEKVVLTWATTEEKNSAHFDIERSPDTRNWASIGRVLGKGTVTAFNTYRLEDAEPLPGVSYYRLKQVDNDQSFAYSHMVSVHRPGFTASVFPSPADNILYIKLPDQKSRFSYLITDTSGKVRQRNYVPSQGSSIPIGGLTAGLYVIRIQNNDGTSTSMKFIKK